MKTHTPLERSIAATKLLIASGLINDARRLGAVLPFEVGAQVGAEANRLFMELEALTPPPDPACADAEGGGRG